MTTLEDELRAALRAEAQTLTVPERPALDAGAAALPHDPRRRWLVAAACLALVVAGVVSIDPRRDDERTTVTSDADAGPPTPASNGWIALDAGGESSRRVELVKPGEDVRSLDVPGSDDATEGCAAWSPDGTRLVLGRLRGSADGTSRVPELVVVPVDRDGEAGAPNVIPLAGFGALQGFDPHPCATWAPDGRWVALRGPGEVWVVDTRTHAVRRLPDLRPIDLEWRPGTDELAIAGDMGPTRGAEWESTPVNLYTVSTGELRPLGSVRAANVTWSPDGSTLAYTGTYEASSGPDDPPRRGDPVGIWLVDADGTDQRVLVADAGNAVHGIGPVWSPTGDRIAYQRMTQDSFTERHEVVLARVADGIETVIAPLRDATDERVRWYPFHVSWSPDGATLLYSAWRAAIAPIDSSRPFDGRSHMISIPVDRPDEVTVLRLGGGVLFDSDHQWTVTQMWGRQR